MLVLDANILIRAVLGSRVLFLLLKYAGHARVLGTRYRLPGSTRTHPGNSGAAQSAGGSRDVTLDLVADRVELYLENAAS
jgi:hypothetical protein